MNKIQSFISFLLIPVFLIIFLFSCSDNGPGEKEVQTTEVTTYMGHSDTARYVGMTQCRKCHENIYQTFIHTGMGQSYDSATKQKSAALFGNAWVIYDAHRDLSYNAFWSHDDMFINEFRLSGRDTSHSRVEKVDYIIGSGQHTNSHIFNTNGYLQQMPMTFYTQSKQWDLPPGFENGFNSRFSRKIGLECMTCHNSFPDFVKGSENKYNAVPDGINCERCHGPGSIHVQLKSSGVMVDTSKYIDFSIVNPGKLPVDLQFDVCQRCHLQGNAVLKDGKSFYDFKPGMKLSNYMTVFVPKYKGNEDEFIMASHADRLKMSPCFKNSFKAESSETGSLRPYKQSMTCVTCHNPHVSVKVTGKEIFNNVCRNCHKEDEKKGCTEKLNVRMKMNGNNCFSCHMPRSGTIDIPHVTSTDHYIRKPVTKKKKEEVKEFIGLYAVNEKNPDAVTRAKGFINQYEKFEFKSYYLDSAEKYLDPKGREDIIKKLKLLVQLNFMKNNHKKIISYVETVGKDNVLTICNKQTYDNLDAWTLYRISESYSQKNPNEALLYISKACELAPYNLDFQLKLGGLLAATGNNKKAAGVFEFVIKENPKIPAALVNLGYLKLLEGNEAVAEQLYNRALKLDPDYEQGLMNLAGLHIYRKEIAQAKELLKRILKKNPSNSRAAEILRSI